MTEGEKLAARAKRWGLESQAPPADADPEAKLAARAKRFELPKAPEEAEEAKAARAKRFEKPSDMSEADKEKLAARVKRWEVNWDVNDGVDFSCILFHLISIGVPF